MGKISTDSGMASDDALASSALRMLLQDNTYGDEKGYLYRASKDAWIEGGVWIHTAKLDGRVVGGCTTSGTGVASLASLVVDQTERGFHAGRAVVEAAIAHERGRGTWAIELVVRVTENGLPGPAVALYRSLGFKMLPGIFVNAIRWTPASAHLWDTRDPDGGVFRNRVMRLTLEEDPHHA